MILVKSREVFDGDENAGAGRWQGERVEDDDWRVEVFEERFDRVSGMPWCFI